MDANKPKKKGKGLKIVVIILIIVMAMIIGVLSWLLISGKSISDIFNKNNQGQEDNKGQNVVSTDNGNGNATGKGGDGEDPANNTSNANLKDSFKIRLDTRGVRNITIEGASFVCNEDVPDISGISSSAAEKIEKKIADIYSKKWEEINKQTSDDYIKELLTQMNKNSGEYGPQDIGFHQTVKVIHLTNNVVTLQTSLEGGLGGVSWGTSTATSFDLETGEVIEVKKIVSDKAKYIDACKKYAFDELKKDERYTNVLEMHSKDYEGIINSAIEKLEGYLIEEGIVCAEVDRYAIADGASGEFKFTVPYSAIKDYVNTQYLKYIPSTGATTNTTSTQNSKQEAFTTEQLEKMALDYYEAKTGYRPTGVASQANDDGTISIQLYDNMGDHNSTSDWYTVDKETAVGTDIMGNKIDLKEKPARQN